MRTKKNKNKDGQRPEDILIADFNASDFPRPEFDRVIDLFEAQVKKTPENIALEFGSRKITYRELDKEAAGVADFLADFLTKTQQKIYVLADSNPELIISFLGILKSGNILVPLNPAFPEEKIKEIFTEVTPDFIIVQKKYLNFLLSSAKNISGLGVLVIDETAAGRVKKDGLTIINKGNIKEPSVPTVKKIRPAACPYAYIYFTSGSTGRPKAVITPNASISLNAEREMKDYLGTDARVAHFFSVYMHVSIRRGILPALCNGATYCLPEKDELLFDANSFFRWLEDNRITLLSFPTVFFKYFVDGLKNNKSLPTLKYLFVMTDKFGNDKYLKRFFAKTGRRIRLINIYGSNEAPLGFNYEITPADLAKKWHFLPIGRSSAGKALVIGKDDRVVSAGQTGEIILRSPYLAAGYYNNPELTAKAFVQNPFSREAGDIVYRSGDMGRLLPDGNIQCMGRVDQQIKIGGYQVGLGEIEAAFKKHPAVKDCVVIADKTGGLTAYYTHNKKIKTENLAAFMKKILPGYMIPGSYIALDKIPLNSNNKIDRAALPPSTQQRLIAPVDPKTPTGNIQKKILAVWQAVLGVKDIDVNDDFFSMGGTSIKAIQASYRLKKRFNIGLPAVMIFKYPTIVSLADHLSNGSRAADKKTAKTKERNLKSRALLSQAIKLLKK